MRNDRSLEDGHLFVCVFVMINVLIIFFRFQKTVENLL